MFRPKTDMPISKQRRWRKPKPEEAMQVPGLAVLLGVPPQLAYAKWNKRQRFWQRPEGEIWDVLKRARDCYVNQMRNDPRTEITTAWARLRRIAKTKGFEI